MRHSATRHRGPAGELHDVLNMRWPHDAAVVHACVHEELIELDVLLCVRRDKIVILQPGNGEHRRAIDLGVVEAVQKVNAAGAGGSQTDAESSGQLGVGAGHERGRFLMADLHETDGVLAHAKRLHDAVDAIAGQAEHHIDTPIDQGFHQSICRGSHDSTTPYLTPNGLARALFFK
jgi:hypothetical protein